MILLKDNDGDTGWQISYTTESDDQLKEKMKNLPRLRHNLKIISSTYSHAIYSFRETPVIKNSQKLHVPNTGNNHVKSICRKHFAQEQAIVFPAIIMEQVKDAIKDWDFTFIPDDHKHDGYLENQE